MINPFSPRALQNEKKSGREERRATRAAIWFYTKFVALGFAAGGVIMLVLKLTGVL